MTQKNTTAKPAAPPAARPAPKTAPLFANRRRASRANRIGWTRWTAGDFVLQLGTVVIGILITFGGSALMQRCSDRRETAIILGMVKDELQKNAALIGERKADLLFDYHGSLALKPYMDDPGAIHPDSLAKYMRVISGYRTFAVVTNSFEVLKSSSQVQSIRNKELLRDLFTTYENMKLFEKNVLEYSSIRETGVNEMFYTSDADRYMTGRQVADNALLFADLMKIPLFRNFIIHLANENWSYLRRRADSILTEITAIVEAKDKEAGL